MAIELGSRPAVLSPAVDDAMERGIRASDCKLLVAGREHVEIPLPDGTASPELRARVAT